MTEPNKRKVVASRRFRLDSYVRGRHGRGGECCPRGDTEALADHFFPSPEAAVAHWLGVGWDYEHPDPGLVDVETFSAAEALLTETAVVVDRQLRRVVRVVTYRWAELGESRLPVATILDVPAGTTTTATVEDQDRQAA